MVGVAAQLEWDRGYGQGCAGGEQAARTRQITPSAHAVGLVHVAGQSAEGAAAVKQAGLLPSQWAHKEKMCKQHMQPGHMLTRPACVPGRGRAFHSCSCSLLISRGTVGSFSCGRSPADSSKVMGRHCWLMPSCKQAWQNCHCYTCPWLLHRAEMHNSTCIPGVQRSVGLLVTCLGLTWRFLTSTLFPHSTMGMFSHTLHMAQSTQSLAQHCWVGS